jgi:ubiquinone/menaquinone biosynthesis C-methylase UbiE
MGSNELNISTKSIYDQRYAGDYREQLSGYEIARWEALEHFISRVLALNSAKKILDYGAGSGLHAALWEEVFPEAELNFCDISSVAMEKFKAKYPRYAERYCLIRDERADFSDNMFDVVVSIEVMEHVQNLISYLQDIHRLLKPGGRFVWTTPCGNLFSIEQVFGALTRKIEPTKEGYRRWKWEEPSHLRRLKSREIGELLQRNGFDDVQFRFRAHFFSFVCTYLPTRKLKWLRERLMTLDYRLFRRFPNAASMVGSARKSAL